MADVFKDFYAEFEGKPESILFLNGHKRLRCWEGHIAALLDTVLPDDGEWTGLAEAYHLDYWVDHPRQVINNDECLTQLLGAEVGEGFPADHTREVNEVRQALVDLFQEAVTTRGKVVFMRD